jgi:hypothetical protein
MKKNKKKLIIWSAIMAGIIVVAFSVMSIVMVSNKINYGGELMPSYDYVSKIRIVNGVLTGKTEAETDAGATEISKNHVREILARLESAGKTDRFAQVFGGQHGGTPAVTKNLTNAFSESSANGVYIKIVFKSAVQYSIVADPSGEYNKYNIERYSAQSASTRLTAIYVPLGNAADSFTEQTWYLEMNVASPTSTSAVYKFTTYGNYRGLADYVRGIDRL